MSARAWAIAAALLVAPADVTGALGEGRATMHDREARLRRLLAAPRAANSEGRDTPGR